MFVIQYLTYPEWHHKWAAAPERYSTLEEAKAAFDKLPMKCGYRIAEEYTVIRYKPIAE